MQFRQLNTKDARLIYPEPHKDSRGLFSRVFCCREFGELGLSKNIVQVNHSLTRKAFAIRGMHYQDYPKAEIKMVKCIKGAVFDVIVDIRKNSPSFLEWASAILTAENMAMMFVPEGFAHGFQTLEPDTELLYFHTEFYSPEYENGIRFDDPAVGINWPELPSEMSEKDRDYPLLTNDFPGLENEV